MDVVQDGVTLGLVKALNTDGHRAVREDSLEPGYWVRAHLRLVSHVFISLRTDNVLEDERYARGAEVRWGRSRLCIGAQNGIFH